MELTTEQIELATREFYRVADGREFYNGKGVKEAIAAAAPYLQLPWSSVITDAEADQYGALYYTNTGIRLDQIVLRHMLASFVANRNAALLPNPDPRREKILAVIRGTAYMSFQVGAEVSVVDRIIAALDEVK